MEIESKYALLEADFLRLLKGGRVLGVIDQLNVYYDDGRRISDISGTLRLRLFDKRAPVLTLKIPRWQQGAVRGSTELEIEVDKRIPPVVMYAKDLPESVADALDALGIRRVERLGWMRNRRMRVEIAEGVVADFDRSALPNSRVAYEIEVESNDDAVHVTALSLIRDGAPSATPSGCNKYQRFLEALESA